MTPFNLKIITPDKIFFDGETENVIVHTTVGDKGVLARHEPYIAALPIGKLRVMVNGAYRVAAVSSGTIEVKETGDTLILAQSCEWGDEIDVFRAEKAQKLAQERLDDKKTSQKDFEIAEFKLKRAVNRLKTAGK
ncbi:MAG: ATP synthase F1 subunit epsilon [Oscillospiraceae bacterium]|jgi:F-type H+-transporting ATPase subunit epsilon|nr:ATP synthase F1 subunit epsilon [Oscillospiraceae bacterium]